MVLTEKTPLTLVRERVDFVTPAALEVEPGCWRVRIRRRGHKALGFAEDVKVLVVFVAFLGVVVEVGVVVQRRIPQGTFVGLVLEELEGQDVGMGARERIHGVRADGRVDDGTLAALLDCFEGVGLAALVLGEEDAARDAVLEADHAMLPVAYMVAKSHTHDRLTKIVGVEEEPKGVDNAGTLVDNYQHSRGIRVSVHIGLMSAGSDLSIALALPVPIFLELAVSRI